MAWMLPSSPVTGADPEGLDSRKLGDALIGAGKYPGNYPAGDFIRDRGHFPTHQDHDFPRRRAALHGGHPAIKPALHCPVRVGRQRPDKFLPHPGLGFVILAWDKKTGQHSIDALERLTRIVRRTDRDCQFGVGRGPR